MTMLGLLRQVLLATFWTLFLATDFVLLLMQSKQPHVDSSQLAHPPQPSPSAELLDSQPYIRA